MTLADVLAKLHDARPLLDTYGVDRIGVFGSTARGEAGPDSDVDLLVSFRDRTPGLRFFTLQRELADRIGRPVDLYTANEFSEPLRRRVLADLVPL